METTTYTLSEVTADSFRGRSNLVHAVANGGALCGKVKSENLCGYADKPLSCPTCEKIVARRALALEAA